MKKKLLIISILAAISISTVFTGCGSNTSTNTVKVNQNVFNKATAGVDSKKALESFLNSHKNDEMLVNSTDGSEIKAYVNKNFSQYFTSNFINDTGNQIDTGTIIHQHATFYLTQETNSTNFCNDFYIDSPTINKENKTVIYPLTEKSAPVYVLVQMKQENGKWKIDKVNN